MLSVFGYRYIRAKLRFNNAVAMVSELTEKKEYLDALGLSGAVLRFNKDDKMAHFIRASALVQAEHPWAAWSILDKLIDDEGYEYSRFKSDCKDRIGDCGEMINERFFDPLLKSELTGAEKPCFHT